ncbi:hypothetical protein LguiA_019586 [Lonicera macranthoides]
MMEAGVYFGHGIRKSNPKMAPYISAKRKGNHITNLTRTAHFLSEACKGNPIDCSFLQTSGKSMKKTAQMIRSLRHPKMKGVISWFLVREDALLGAPFDFSIEAEPKHVLQR